MNNNVEGPIAFKCRSKATLFRLVELTIKEMEKLTQNTLPAYFTPADDAPMVEPTFKGQPY